MKILITLFLFFFPLTIISENINIVHYFAYKLDCSSCQRLDSEIKKLKGLNSKFYIKYYDMSKFSYFDIINKLEKVLKKKIYQVPLLVIGSETYQSKIVIKNNLKNIEKKLNTNKYEDYISNLNIPHTIFYKKNNILKQFFSFKIIFLIIFFVMFYVIDKNILMILLSDIRHYRMLHYILMIIFGVFFAAETNKLYLTFNFMFDLFFLNLSLIFAIIFSIITNNISDYKIDLISNPNRPLQKHNISRKKYIRIAVLFFLLSVFYSFLLGIKIFILIFLFMFNYYIYSMKPLRLKRFFLISKLLIGVNTLLMMFSGYILTNGNLIDFPIYIIIYVLVLITLTINFIDIKDYEGDKKYNIKTLPVLVGLKKSKKIIGVFFVLAYVVASIKYIITIFGAPILYIILNRKEYKEKYVFIAYLSGLIILLTYIYLIQDLQIEFL